MAPATDAEPRRVASGCTSDHSAEITPSHQAKLEFRHPLLLFRLQTNTATRQGWRASLGIHGLHRTSTPSANRIHLPEDGPQCWAGGPFVSPARAAVRISELLHWCRRHPWRFDPVCRSRQVPLGDCLFGSRRASWFEFVVGQPARGYKLGRRENRKMP